jgi:hypothetical protein
MKSERAESWVPESILIYRKYEALMNDAQAQVIISLARMGK